MILSNTQNGPDSLDGIYMATVILPEIGIDDQSCWIRPSGKESPPVTGRSTIGFLNTDEKK
ncbi:MAG: hypothetical protein WCJ09_25840 [Planctomycetota bacterium]